MATRLTLHLFDENSTLRTCVSESQAANDPQILPGSNRLPYKHQVWKTTCTPNQNGWTHDLSVYFPELSSSENGAGSLTTFEAVGRLWGLVSEGGEHLLNRDRVEHSFGLTNTQPPYEETAGHQNQPPRSHLDDEFLHALLATP